MAITISTYTFENALFLCDGHLHTSLPTDTVWDAGRFLDFRLNHREHEP